MSDYGVSPSSSASQFAGGSIPTVQGFSPERCMDMLIQLSDRGLIDSVSVLPLIKQSFGAYHAYLRTLGVVTGQDSKPPSSTASSSVSRSSWRSGGRCVKPQSKDLDWRSRSTSVLSSRPGYCYRDLMTESGKARADIGPNPSFYSLMALPAEGFLEDDLLAKKRVSRPVGGVCHVGAEGLSAYELLSTLAKSSAMAYTGPESMWSRMRVSAVPADAQVARAYPMVSSLGGTESVPFGATLERTCTDYVQSCIRGGEPVSVPGAQVQLPVGGSDAIVSRLVRGPDMDVVFVIRRVDEQVVGFIPVPRGKSSSQLVTEVYGHFDTRANVLHAYACSSGKIDPALQTEELKSWKVWQAFTKANGDRMGKSLACVLQHVSGGR